MSRHRRELSRFAVGSVWACGLSLVLGSACGSEDSARKDPQRDLPAGAGGEDAGVAGHGPAPVGGAPTNVAGSGSSAGSPGGVPGGGAAGEPSVAGTGTGGAMSGAAGEGGAAGEDCASVEPTALRGVWTSDCNGYSCAMTITESGDVGNGCTNGQYETGTLAEGELNTLGEGGPYQPYSTKGTLTRTACDSVTRDYIGQIPPNTGPEQTYSCVLTRAPSCAPSLLQALAGAWNGACGTSTCVTTITAEGGMTSTCSNGQQSAGTVEETGYFSDVGSGGNFPAYSTTGVIALTDCDSFVMAYTWQMPPNSGTKTSAKCTYTRQQDQ